MGPAVFQKEILKGSKVWKILRGLRELTWSGFCAVEFSDAASE